LSKFALREDKHVDMEENFKNEVNNSDLKSEPNSFFMEIKEHLICTGDSFLVKAFENYLPFKQSHQDVKPDVLKKKEQLYMK
jgi:hypothetical protein